MVHVCVCISDHAHSEDLFSCCTLLINWGLTLCLIEDRLTSSCFVGCLLASVFVVLDRDTLCTRTTQIKEGLNCFFCLVPYNIITFEVSFNRHQQLPSFSACLCLSLPACLSVSLPLSLPFLSFYPSLVRPYCYWFYSYLPIHCFTFLEHVWSDCSQERPSHAQPS